MGKDSSIQWTHHTFNPWWGCCKVSAGCEHCYAESLSKKFGDDVWPRKLRDQCQEAEIAFHFKQWGHWAPATPGKFVDSKSRKFWDQSAGEFVTMRPLGKIQAGRLLDGSTWDQFPEGLKSANHAAQQGQICKSTS